MKKIILFTYISTCISTGLFAAWPDDDNAVVYTRSDGGTDTNNVANVVNEASGLVTYENSSTLQILQSIINDGSISFETGGILDNQGTLTNNSSVSFETGGSLNNMGTLTNDHFLSRFFNLAGNTLNNSGDINGDGELDNYGILNNNSGGTLSPRAYFNVDTLNNNLGGTLNIIPGGVLFSYIGATLNNYGILNNDSGTLTNFQGTFNNSGTLSNSGFLGNQGYLNNSGTLNNDGILSNSGGVILDNHDTLNNSANGTLNNSGTLQNFGTLNNDGDLINEIYSTLRNNPGSTLNNSGELSGDGALQNFTATLNNNSGGLLNVFSFYNDSIVNNHNGGIINIDTDGATLVNLDGTLNNASGGIVDIQAGGALINIFSSNLNNDGTLNNSGFCSSGQGSTLSNSGILNNFGDLIFQTGSTFIQSGALNLNSGRLSLGQNIPLEVNDQVMIGTVQVILDKGASLDINNRSSDVTFQQPIINAGTLSNTGGLILNSNVTTVLIGENTFPGETHVNTGTLYVNGPSLASPGSLITKVFVENATFGGTKYTRLKHDPSVPGSGNLDLGDNSIVAPGGDALFGQLTVDGDIHFSETTAMFDLEVDSVSNTDKIVVGGEAHLDGKLEIDAATGFFITGQRITVIEADGGVFNSFNNTHIPPGPDGNPLFRVDYTDTTVDLVVLEDSIFADNQLQSGNPQSVANYILAQEPIDPNSDFGFVVESIGLLSDKALNKALNLMHPGSFALFEGMNLTNNAQVMQILSQHFFKVPQGGSQEAISLLEPSLTASTGDRPFYPNTPVRQGCSRDGSKHHNVWVQPFGSWNSQSQKGQLRGANYDTAGILAGYDYLFDNFYVGGALGYTYTNFRWQGSAGKGDIDQVYGGLYSSYFMKYFAVTLSTMVGGNFYETNRRIKYNAPDHPGANLDRTAHSSSSGIQWTNHLGLIGDLNPLSVPLRAFANLDHFFLHNGSFNESGAKSLNLNVDSKTSNALRSEVGLSSSYTFDLKGGCWTPYAQLSFVNKTLLGSSSYTGGFRGQTGTFSVNATSKSTNQVSPGIGIEFANKNGFSVLVNSRAELNGKVKN